ncbi:hypothetical protein FEP90_05397 [Burkholderia multivorans]|nr:hypothetical protein [Burkholderia multivorans]
MLRTTRPAHAEKDDQQRCGEVRQEQLNDGRAEFRAQLAGKPLRQRLDPRVDLPYALRERTRARPVVRLHRIAQRMRDGAQRVELPVGCLPVLQRGVEPREACEHRIEPDDRGRIERIDAGRDHRAARGRMIGRHGRHRRARDRQKAQRAIGARVRVEQTLVAGLAVAVQQDDRVLLRFGPVAFAADVHAQRHDDDQADGNEARQRDHHDHDRQDAERGTPGPDMKRAALTLESRNVFHTDSLFLCLFDTPGPECSLLAARLRR